MEREGRLILPLAHGRGFVVCGDCGAVGGRGRDSRTSTRNGYGEGLDAFHDCRDEMCMSVVVVPTVNAGSRA